MHDGTIRVESEGKNKGSEFIVTLPRKTERTVMTENEQQPHIPYEGRSDIRRVLIVDDNESAAEGIAKLLTLSGFEVRSAYSAADAIKQATAEPRPDAVFLDLDLPDGNGHDIAKTLRSDHTFTGRIITLSGFGQEDDRQASIAAGCDDHLTKPVRLAELLQALK